jgi:hypothetical protein
VTAVRAQNALPGDARLQQPHRERRQTARPDGDHVRPHERHRRATGKLKAGVPIEPLVLRANAGDCIEVTLVNKLPANRPLDLDGWNTMPMIVEHFNANQVKPSAGRAAPAALFYDVTSDGADVGFNVGLNPETYRRSNRPAGAVKYKWYAGDVTHERHDAVATPIEFGATNLISSDPIKHSNKGAFGSLIIEPQGSTWIEDTNSRAQATVTKTDGTSFREFVMSSRPTSTCVGATTSAGNGVALPNTAEAEDAEDSGQKAINYRTEPLWKRMGFDPDTPLTGTPEPGEPFDPRTPTRDYDFTNVLSNSQIGGYDPETPIFTANAGQDVRSSACYSPAATRATTCSCSTGTSGRRSPTRPTPPPSEPTRSRSGRARSTASGREATSTSS